MRDSYRFLSALMLLSLLAGTGGGCKPRRQGSAAKDLASLAQGPVEAPFVSSLADIARIGGSISGMVNLEENILALTTHSSEVLLFESEQQQVAGRQPIPVESNETLSSVTAVKNLSNKFSIAVGTSAGRVFLLNTEQLNLTAPQEMRAGSHKGAISALAFVGDGAFLAIGGVDSLVTVVDIASRELIGTIVQRTKDAVMDRQAVGINALAVTLDEQILIARGSELEVSTHWRGDRQSESEQTLLRHTKSITALGLMEDPLQECGKSSTLALGGIKGVVFAGDQEGKILGVQIPPKPDLSKITQQTAFRKPISTIQCHTPPRNDLGPSYSDNFAKFNSFYSGSKQNGSPSVANILKPTAEFTTWIQSQKGAGRTRIQAHHGAIRTIQVSNDGARLFTLGVDAAKPEYSVAVWDLPRQSLVRMLNYQKYGSIGPLVVRSTKGRDDVLFTSTNGTGLRKFDVTASMSAFSLSKDQKIGALAASPMGRQMIAFESTGMAKLWTFSDDDSTEGTQWGGLNRAEPQMLDLGLTAPPSAAALSGPDVEFYGVKPTLAVFSCREGVSLFKRDSAGTAQKMKSWGAPSNCDPKARTRLQWSRDGEFIYVALLGETAVKVAAWKVLDGKIFFDINVNTDDGAMGLKALQDALVRIGYSFGRDHLPARWFAGSQAAPVSLLQSPWFKADRTEILNGFGIQLTSDAKVNIINFSGADSGGTGKLSMVSAPIPGIREIITNANSYFVIGLTATNKVSLLRSVDPTQTFPLPYLSTQQLGVVSDFVRGPNNSVAFLTDRGLDLWWVDPVIE